MVLAQAVMQQARFDPNALHIEEDDEDITGVCPHCLNPPVPPLREKRKKSSSCPLSAISSRLSFCQSTGVSQCAVIASELVETESSGTYSP